jgi:hypothetical protein
MAVLAQDALDHAIHLGNVDLLAVFLEDLDRASAKRSDILKRAVHLIGIEAGDGLAALGQVLRDEAGDEGLANPSLALLPKFRYWR